LSTELPTSPHGFTLVESESLALARELAALEVRMKAWLMGRLRDEGFTTISEAQLVFLGELDCGVNHAAELARRLGISRQAIHKSVRDLSSLGLLETASHPELGNQRIIRFTLEGERLISRARAHFAMLDKTLQSSMGANGLADLNATLAKLLN